MTDSHAGQMEKSSQWEKKWVVNGAGKGREIFKEDEVEKKYICFKGGSKI